MQLRRRQKQAEAPKAGALSGRLENLEQRLGAGLGEVVKTSKRAAGALGKLLSLVSFA